MTFDDFDLCIRTGGASLLLFVAAMLWRSAPREPTGRLFLPLSVGLSAFLLNNSDGPSLFSGQVEAATNVLAGLTVPFLWWFCLALFDRAFQLRGATLAVGLLWTLLAVVDRPFLGLDFAIPIASYGLIGLGLVIVAHLGWKLIGDRDDDLVEWRRRARPWVVLVLGTLLLVDLGVDLLVGFSWRPAWFALSQNLAIVAFAAWFGLAISRVDSGVLFSRLQTLAARPANAKLAAKVASLIVDQRLFLDPEISFASFVARTGHGERAVRDHINRDLGHDHFRSFLNAHRVGEACRRLASPAHAGDKLISIALDSGFASLASFNRSFRAITGRTPSEFRAAPFFEEPIAGF